MWLLRPTKTWELRLTAKKSWELFYEPLSVYKKKFRRPEGPGIGDG
jgi:hypothetical protein